MACSALFRHVHMIAHPPPTMLRAPSEHEGESMYPRFKNRGIIAPPHPLFFLRHCGAEDLAFRIGADEFVSLHLGLQPSEAPEVVRRVRGPSTWRSVQGR